jgi:pimeloyl-ACP methyl ester carboxylesterase
MAGRESSTIRMQGPQGGLNVHLCGSKGAPVLLVHGNGGRGSQWEHQLAGLGQHYRVAALDLRGMGASDPPRNGDFSIGGFAEDVAAVAEALACPRLVLVGHSLGAYVVAACAGLYPERLAGLVFVDQGGDARDASEAELEGLTGGLAPEAFAAFSRQALATCLQGARPQVKEQVLAHLQATPGAHFAQAILGLLDFDARAALSSFQGPMLHLHSGFLKAQNLLPIHAQVPGIEAILVRDCSHWVHLDQPDLFNAHLHRFLNRLALDADGHPTGPVRANQGA